MAETARVRVGRYEFDAMGRCERLELSWRAQQALAALIERRGDVVGRDTLFERLWPDVAVEDSNLTKVISELRRALAEIEPDAEYITTVPGRGYRLGVPVEVIAYGQPADTRWRWIAVGAVAATAALVALSFATTRSAAPSQSEADAAYAEAMTLLAKQSWAPRQKAIPLLRRVIELEPAHAQAHSALGFALMDAKGHDVSLAAARKAVELEPECAPCQATLGYVLETLDWDWVNSRKHLAKAAALDPHDGRTSRWYSHNLAVSGELEQALVEAEHAVRLAPLESGPLVNKAAILYLMKHYQKAIIAADAAIALEYNSTGAWEFRSKTLFQLGRHKEAIGDVFRQWAPWQPLIPETMARLKQDGWRAALDQFLHAPNTSAKHGNNPYHRAWWFTLLGRPDDAMTELEAGLELRPYNMVYTAVDPGFESLRGTERFGRILAKLGRD